MTCYWEGLFFLVCTAIEVNNRYNITERVWGEVKYVWIYLQCGAQIGPLCILRVNTADAQITVVYCFEAKVPLLHYSAL